MISRDAFLEHAEVLVITMALRVRPLSKYWRPVSMFFSISTGRARSKFARKCRTRGVSLFYRRPKLNWTAVYAVAVRTAKRSLQSVWRKLLQK